MARRLRPRRAPENKDKRRGAAPAPSADPMTRERLRVLLTDNENFQIAVWTPTADRLGKALLELVTAIETCPHPEVKRDLAKLAKLLDTHHIHAAARVEEAKKNLQILNEEWVP